MGTDALKIEGFVEIELINKKDHVRRTYKNTITNCGKKYMLAKSAGNIMRMGAEILGNSRGIGVTGRHVNSAQAVKLGHSNWELTNVCLNLSAAELAALDGSATCVDVWDSNMDTASKLIGYANNNVATQSGDTKQGVLDNCKGEYVIAGDTVAKRWHYPAGIASGTINCIAMMPADAIKNKFSAGLGIMKSIDVANQQVNSGMGAYHFLPPGVTGFTGSNEILLDTTSGRWKFNLSTGEYSEVAAGDPFAVIPSTSNYGCADVLVKDGIVTYIDGDGDAQQFYIKYYNPSTNTNANVVALASASSYKFLEYNGNTYAIAIKKYGNTSSSNYIIYKLSFTNGVPSLVDRFDDYSELTTAGFVLPTGLSTEFTRGNIGFSNYGSNYIMWHAVGSDTYGNGIAGWVFTDPTDIAGSIIGYIGQQDCNSPILDSGSILGILNMYRYPYWDNSYLNLDDNELGINVVNAIATGTPVGTRYNDMNTNYLCMDGWSGNVMSFVKLSTAITKSDEDEMYVSYGYRVV